MGEGHSCQCSGEDRISGLPDELLHVILLRIGSARAAPRTSVLSRRWRHVWNHMPELLLSDSDPDAPRRPPASVLVDAIDAALGAYSAPTLQRLHISFRNNDDDGPPVPACRAVPWLRFASQRVVGELHLHVPSWLSSLLAPEVEEQAELELPVCARAKTVTLSLQGSWQLRPQLDGLFNALTCLSITSARMEASELTALVCKHCPRLRDLRLVVELLTVSDVSVLSDSLHSLRFFVHNTSRLEVIAPMLQKLSLSLCRAAEARICCPKLAEVVWLGIMDDNHPRYLKFDNVGRLWLLDISQRSMTLMRHFDEVDVLRLQVIIPWEIEGYKSFLNEATQLPRCEILRISLIWYRHSPAPGILHLLRSCNSTRKISVLLHGCTDPSLANSCPLSCTCHLAESYRIDDIALNSLEEVEICNFKSSNEELKFMELLSRCNASVLKKLVINYSALLTATPLTNEICEKVHSMWRPSVKVELYVFLDRRRVRFNYLKTSEKM